MDLSKLLQDPTYILAILGILITIIMGLFALKIKFSGNDNKVSVQNSFTGGDIVGGNKNGK